MRTAVTAVLILLGVGGANAGPGNSTPELVAACKKFAAYNPSAKSDPDAFLSSVACSHFVGGFVSGLEVQEAATPRICIPQSAEYSQLIAVYIQWADRNAPSWHLPPGATMARAFAEAFPCNK